MTPFEWLAVAYFAALAAAASRAERPRRGLLYVCGAIALVIVARFTLPWAARAWLGHAYLVLGYWIPAAFIPSARNERFERWLARADAWLSRGLKPPRYTTWLSRGLKPPRYTTWLSRGLKPSRYASSRHASSRDTSCRDTSPVGTPTRSARASALAWPQHVGVRDLGLAIFELSYLLCYPLVPAAFAVVFMFGSRADVEWFWVAVLTAGYVCYGTLPWTAARPPRLATGAGAPRGLGRLNAHVLGRVSHQLVTFPSGHVAVSLAAALVVARVAPVTAAGFGIVAGLIAVAAVAGRYHYLIDVVLGVLLGAVVPALTGSFG